MKSFTELSPHVKSIVVFLITFVGWILIQYLVWGLLHAIGDQGDIFPLVEAISAALTAATFFGAGFIAYYEIEEMTQTHYLEVVDRLFNELNSHENIIARRWVIQNLPDKPKEEEIKDFIQNLDETGRHYIKRVLNSIDRVAFIWHVKGIPKDKIMPWMNPMIVKPWIKLKPIVEYEAKRRNEPDYYQNAQQIGNECLTWRKNYLPETEITWVERAL